MLVFWMFGLKYIKINFTHLLLLFKICLLNMLLLFYFYWTALT